MQVTTVREHDLEQAQQTARQAADLLARGELVVFPTETVYGVAASAASDAGYAALCTLKGEEPGRPFTVHLPDPASAERYIDVTSPLLRRLMHKVWPGPVSLIVDVTEEQIQTRMRDLGVSEHARPRIYHNHTVSLRCPDHPLAAMILGAQRSPIVASSANRRGDAPALDADEAARSLGRDVSMVVDGGRSRYGKASTLVRVRGTGGGVKITVERAGVYDERFIHKLLRWTMLVVCSGNTCRSPMAEGLAKQMLAEQRGIKAEELDTAGVRVISAGAFAGPGAPATAEAIDALQRFGADISKHRSRSLTPDLIHEADVIYCMTHAHRDAVLAMVPAAEGKTFLLDPNGEIEDPIGSDLTAYQRTAEVIRRRLSQRLKEQQP
jgi:protein-tyrosine phosphatase